MPQLGLDGTVLIEQAIRERLGPQPGDHVFQELEVRSGGDFPSRGVSLARSSFYRIRRVTAAASDPLERRGRVTLIN